MQLVSSSTTCDSSDNARPRRVPLIDLVLRRLSIDSARMGEAEAAPRPCLKGWSGVTALIVSMCFWRPAVRNDGDLRIRPRDRLLPSPSPPPPLPLPPSPAAAAARAAASTNSGPPLPPILLTLLLPMPVICGNKSKCGGPRPRRSSESSTATSGFVAGLSSDRGRSSRPSNDSPRTSTRPLLEVVARALFGRGVRTVVLPRGSV